MNFFKILIVEDNILASNEIADYLKDHKYTLVGQAISGEKAIELAEINQPDIILMDIHLAGELDGIQAAEIIQKKLPIPIIYLSKITDDKTFQRANKRAPITYLSKPFKPIDVKFAIEASIKTYSMFVEKKKGLFPKRNNFTEQPEVKDHFVLKRKIFIRNKHGSFSGLKLDEVTYILTNNHNIIIHTLDGERKINYVFSQFLEQINFYPIYRIHKQIAVNADYVSEISRKEIRIEYQNKSGVEISKLLQISKAYQEEVLKKFRVLV